MDISVKLKLLYKSYQIPQFLCGFEALKPRLRYNFFSFLSGATCLMYYICALNTIITWPLTSTLELLSACGIAITGSIKLITTIAYFEEIHEVFEEMEELCESILVSGRLSRRYKIFDNYINLCKLIDRSYHILFLIGSIGICLYPGIMYYLVDEVVFPFSCYIPFLDPYSRTGYATTMIFQLFCLFTAYNGTITFDTFFIFGVIQCAVSVDTFQVKIEEYNQLLIANADNHDQSSDKIKKSLIAIIKAHQTISNCVSRMRVIFYWSIAVQVSLSVVSLAISLFMVIKTTWFVAYATCAVSLYQLLMYSILGTVIQSKSEDLVPMVYETLWYLLPGKEKETFHIFFMNVQNTLVIYIADLRKLNVSTCVSILKTVYTYFMMLLELA